MEKHKYHWSFRLWVKLRGTLAVMAVLAGLLVGIFSLILPFDQLYKDRLISFLEEQWRVSVAVQEVEGSWRGYGPHFQLNNLTLSGKQDIHIAETTLAINVYEYLIPGGKTGIDLKISQADLAMIHSEDGPNFTVNNEQDGQSFTETLDKILTSGALEVSALQVNVMNDQGLLLLEGLKAGFLLEQDDNNRAMSLTIGHEDAFLQINGLGGKQDLLSKNAEWHMTMHQFNLAEFNELQEVVTLPSTILNGQIWIHTDDGVINKASGSIQWEMLGMSGIVHWQHQGDNQNWSSWLKLDNLTSVETSYPDVNGMLQRSGESIYFVADQVSLSALATILEERTGYSFDAQGELKEIEARYDLEKKQWQEATAAFNLANLVINDISASQLSGQLAYLDDQWRFFLDSAQGQLTIPSVFRGQLKWETLLAQLTVSHSVNWRVMLNDFWCDCENFEAEAQMQLWQQGAEQAPRMQLQARVHDVTVAELHHYWPYRVWKPKTIQWLDESLLSGQVPIGYLFYQGQLVDEAFNNGLAFFNSRAELENLSVEFHPQWPVVNDLSGTAYFTGNGFETHVDSAYSKELDIFSTTVNMPSYKQGMLTVELSAQSEGNELLSYLNKTPIIRTIPLDDKLTLSGKQKIDTAIDISVKDEHELRPYGQIWFEDAGLETVHLSLSKMNGNVALDGYELKIKKLSAELIGQGVSLDGTVKMKTDHGLSIDIGVNGDLEVSDILFDQGLHLPISGESHWNIGIKSEQQQLLMSLHSDLKGTEIGLPAPLNKSHASVQPFSLNCYVPCRESDIHMKYSDEIDVKLTATDSGWAIKSLIFGEVVNESSKHSVLGGQITQLDIDNWLKWVKKWSLESSDLNEWQLPASSFELEVTDMLFLARHFKEVKLAVERLEDKYHVVIDNSDMKGMLEVADNLATKGVVADFEYLHWKEADIEDISTVTDDVEQMPDLHVYAQQFSYLDIPLGSLRLELRNVIDGSQVEQMSLTSDTSNIQVTGHWRAPEVGDTGLGVSNFNVVMTSEKFAEFLEGMSFDAPISNTQTLIELNAQWPGTPSMFDLKNISGTLDLTMGEGEVLDTKPGFGRVLGLFSLTDLPRRLMLDFKDVIAEDLHFKSMEGHFNIADGFATTDDFTINASSVKIMVRGETNFAQKTYNQTITVEPQVGKTLPTIGAIAGGAVGAAAGFFLQGIFNKQLKSSNRIMYHVTGTWDQPIIELLNDE